MVLWHNEWLLPSRQPHPGRCCRASSLVYCRAMAGIPLSRRLGHDRRTCEHLPLSETSHAREFRLRTDDIRFHLGDRRTLGTEHPSASHSLRGVSDSKQIRNVDLHSSMCLTDYSTHGSKFSNDGGWSSLGLSIVAGQILLVWTLTGLHSHSQQAQHIC